MLRLSFQQAVLLFPVATLAHIREEWPGFPAWARQFASPAYSDREYVIAHILTVAMAFAAAILTALFPHPAVLFIAFCVVLGPAGFWNGLFHTSASVATGSFCPGAVTGFLLYVPLVLFLAVLANRDGILSTLWLMLAFLLALAFHVLEVGHSVFKRW